MSRNHFDDSMGSVPHGSMVPDHHTQQMFIPTAASGYATQQLEKTEFSLQSLLSVLYRYRYLILITTIASIGLSALFTEKIEPVYEAHAMASVGRYIPPIEGPTGRLLSNESGRSGYVDAQLPLLRSFTIAELVLTQDPEITEYLEKNIIPKGIVENDPSAIRSPEINLTTLIEDGTLKELQMENADGSLQRDSSIQYSTMTRYLDLISYDLIKNSTMVQITAEAKDPGMAARIANAHAQAFIALVRARLLDNARVNLEFLKQRKDEAQKHAANVRDELVEYAEDNAIFLQLGNKGKGGAVNRQHTDQMWFLMNNLTSTTRQRAEAEASYRLLRDTANGRLIRDNQSRNLELQLAERNADLKSLKRQGLSVNNDYLRRLKLEVKNLKEAIEADRESELRRKEIEFKAIKAQEELLKEEVKKLKRLSVEESKALVKYALLEQEDESAQALSKQLAERLEEVYVHLNSNQKHVRMIDEARAPTISESRRNYINLIIGTIIGPLIGTALAFALDLLDNTIRTVADLQRTVNVPLLGIIPRFTVELDEMISSNYQTSSSTADPNSLIPETPQESPLDGLAPLDFDTGQGDGAPEEPSIIGEPSVIGHWSTDIRKKIDPNSKTPIPTQPPVPVPVPEEPFGAPPEHEQRGGTRATGAGGTGLTGIGEDTHSTEIGMGPDTATGSTTLLTSSSLVLVSAPHSVESEAFRNVRTCVTHGCAGDPPKLILVTSGQKHDGKTTVSCNLAISLAQIAERTLLIDADLRLPTIHRNFSLSRLTPGLSDYLQGYRDYSEVIFETPIPNLCLMLSGEPARNPTELIGSKKMAELLELLSDEFDRIILDSPPITRVADTMLLSRLVEGVVLVVRSGKTPQGIAEAAYGRLKQMDANILGTILNDVQSIPGYRELDYYYVTEVFDEDEFYAVEEGTHA